MDSNRWCDLFQELVTEVLEDITLTEANDEGKPDEPVSRDTIFSILGHPEGKLGFARLFL